MNKQEHLLTCLSEECAEVAHRVSKVLRFGLHDIEPGKNLSNVERLAIEYRDLLAVVELLEEECGIYLYSDKMGVQDKKSKVIRFMEYAKKCGTLEPELPVDELQEWSRNEDRTYATLLLVGGHNVTPNAIASWSDADCKLAEEWALCIHIAASDNDDVIVPRVPACVLPFMER